MAESTRKYWLVKSEPEVYSIDQMAQDRRTLWENIRNYQARNYMAAMKNGDRVLFYHSNAKPPAIVGVVEVSSGVVADPSQFDKKSEYYEPRATLEKPIWQCVEVSFVEKFIFPVSLVRVKAEKSLSKMVLLNNSRLSVQPVTEGEFDLILGLSRGAEVRSSVAPMSSVSLAAKTKSAGSRFSIKKTSLKKETSRRT